MVLWELVKQRFLHKLRELTGAEEIDMDAWIVEKNALSINEMFEKYGETYFRDRETDAVCEIAKSAPAIISCGGGAVLRQENTQIMKESGRIGVADSNTGDSIPTGKEQHRPTAA